MNPETINTPKTTPKAAPTHWAATASPIGELRLFGGPGYLSELQFEDDPADARTGDLTEDAAVFAEPIAQLDEYFAGERRDFELTLAPAGSEFQLSVWNALADIPYGETRSYGDIAVAVGKPRAARAVGGANNKNPIPLIVPCHRVIGTGGTLVGYGGGLSRKTFLLDHEAAVARKANSSS
jgi:methylated-DNA-[protein]-cysteine S-methyltransferase